MSSSSGHRFVLVGVDEVNFLAILADNEAAQTAKLIMAAVKALLSFPCCGWAEQPGKAFGVCILNDYSLAWNTALLSI